jgi:hypothetical protein
MAIMAVEAPIHTRWERTFSAKPPSVRPSHFVAFVTDLANHFSFLSTE